MRTREACYASVQDLHMVTSVHYLKSCCSRELMSLTTKPSSTPSQPSVPFAFGEHFDESSHIDQESNSIFPNHQVFSPYRIQKLNLYQLSILLEY